MSSRKRTPTQEPPAETGTAVAEPPAPEVNGNGQSFAERVGGPRKWTAAPDPFGIAGDYTVGVRLFESKQDRQMAIKFGEGRPEDKPSQQVIDKLKELGYRWQPQNKVWVHPVRSDSAMATRIDAERLFQEIVQMMKAEKGIESGQGMSR